MHLFGRDNRVRKIRRKTTSDGHYFQHRRWQLVTLFEHLSGVWPYQNKLKQYSAQSLHHFVFTCFILASGNKLREYMGVDKSMAVENILAMIFMGVLTVKLVMAAAFQRSRKKMYEHVAEHFNTITDPEEAELLNEFADRGFVYMVKFISLILVALSIFDSLPVYRAFYNYFFADCELVVESPVKVDYGFDHKKYWYLIALNFVMNICSGFMVEFPYDLSFILQVYNVRALFEIVRLRLRRASELVSECEEDAVISADAADEAYSLISSAIDLHSECLKVVEIIEETYNINWFITLLLNSSSLGAFLYVITLKLHDPIETFRYLLVLLVCLTHFQVICTQGQSIIDSSSSISEACYFCKWYGLPRKSRGLLTVMMIRTSLPCQLTGGKLFPLSMENFGKLMKVGLSYYTVFQA